MPQDSDIDGDDGSGQNYRELKQQTLGDALILMKNGWLPAAARRERMNILRTRHGGARKKQMQARTEHTDTYSTQLQMGASPREGKGENDEDGWRDNDGKACRSLYGIDNVCRHDDASVRST